MIEEKKVEQSAIEATKQYDDMLQKMRNSTGQVAMLPISNKEVSAMVGGYSDGFKAGVRFAESELSKPKVLEIDFAGNVKAKFEVNNGEINIIAAVDGWGHAIDPDQVIITQIEQ